MRKKIRVACAAALGMGAAAFVSSRAEAATCDSLIAAESGLTSTVYIAGSTAVEIPLQGLAPVLATKGIAIIYQAPDSCQGVSDLIGHTAESGQPYNFLDPAVLTSGGLATPTTCTLSGTAPPIDIAPSDVSPDTCAKNLNIGTVGAISTTSTTFRDILGPIQAMTFAVPAGSTQSSISAEAAYLVFGYDATATSASPNVIVQPWSVAGSIYTRPNTSGTLNMLATAIGLAPTKFANATPVAPGGTVPPQQQQGTGGMRNALANATSNVNATIGQLSYESIIQAANRSSLKMLAYQHTGQSCGYTPSSTESSLDMINVRQGRYAVWGPVHFIVNVDSSGTPLNGAMASSAAVGTIMNYFLATGPTPPSSSSADAGVSATDIKALITAEAKPAYVVPWCAMQVTRTSEIGAPASYQPQTPCGCYFESVVGVSTSSYCRACSADADCADAGTYTHCRYNFCEAQ